MKTKCILGFIFFLIVLSILSFCLYPVKLKIDYLRYDICTFEPLGISDIKKNEQNYTIKNIDYLRFASILSKLEKSDEIEIDKSIRLVVNFNLDEDEDEDTLNNEFLIPKQTEPNIEKIKLIDRFINVRYVISFPNNKKINKIVLGHNKQIIIVNDNFYLIPVDQYKKLLLFFSEKINDEIDDDNWILYE